MTHKLSIAPDIYNISVSLKKNMEDFNIYHCYISGEITIFLFTYEAYIENKVTRTPDI